MAVVTVKSAAITNRDASPPVINNGRVERGGLKSSIGLCAFASGDSIGSKAILASIPSSAFVRDVVIECDAITTCAADVGVYRNTVDGGAVVDADFFASAQSLASALKRTSIIDESGVNTKANQQLPLWQAVGLTSDPQTTLDIVATLTAAAGSAGSISADVIYVDGGN